MLPIIMAIFGDGIAVDGPRATPISTASPLPLIFQPKIPYQANLRGVDNAFVRPRSAANGTNLGFFHLYRRFAADAAFAIAFGRVGQCLCGGAYLFALTFPVVNAVNLDPTIRWDENAFVTEINSSGFGLGLFHLLGRERSSIPALGSLVDPFIERLCNRIYRFPQFSRAKPDSAIPFKRRFQCFCHRGGVRWDQPCLFHLSGRKRQRQWFRGHWGRHRRRQSGLCLGGGLHLFPVIFPQSTAIQSTESSALSSTVFVILQMGVGGSGLMYSTFLGWNRFYDQGYGIAVDNSGNSYVDGNHRVH